MLYEIRNYNFEPARIDEYRTWAETLALPRLKQEMDIVGFWINNDMEPEYSGSNPKPDVLGPATVTWIIRWKDRSQRDKVWQALFEDQAWQDVRAQVPGGRESYHRIEMKFCTDILK